MSQEPVVQEKSSEGAMVKLARFIVDKRKAFFLVFAILVIFCARSISKTQINDDITSYLPANTETRRGLSIMEEEFTTYASARLMVSNITLERAQALQARLEAVPGVYEAVFDGTEEHYRDASALFDLTFDAPEGDPAVDTALAAVLEQAEGWDCSVAGGNDDTSESLVQEMGVILLIAAGVIVVVLIFTSMSYMEVLVFLVVFVVAAVLNMGTNFLLGEISFITNAIAVVLQLALAIDYAIIFCHRYMEERENGLDARSADIAALSKAIVEISSSSLTTISGLVALMLMQFRLGFDLGIVLSKGIVCSMFTVFVLMPGLLMLFNRGIERTRHRNFVPKITFWGRAVVKTRFVLPAVFLIALLAGIVFSSRCAYVFSVNSTNSGNMPASRLAADKIAGVFGNRNTIAMLVPRGDYEKEGKILRQAEELAGITSATGLAGVEVEDGRCLTDRLTPRQFAELAGVDVELARLLYQAYGLSQEEYGAVFQDTDAYDVPLVDIFRFLLEQMDKGVVTLEGEQAEKVEDLRDTLDRGLLQLQGEAWTRLVFTSDLPEEGEETYALLDQLRDIAARYYGDQVILVGNSTNARDLGASFQGDNLKISVLTVLFVMAILLFTFKSAGLPVLLVLTIQGSIWINFSFPYLTGTNLFFLSYLIVSAIQMGATIDYAIVITNRYMELKTMMDRKTAVVEALNQSFPTILTSGSIMTVAGFLIGRLATNSIISSIGETLGRGTLTSIILVMSVLPQILLLGDALIERTAITLNRDRKQRFQNGTVHLDGHIRGQVSGYLAGEFKGIIHGSVDALIESRRPGQEGPEGREEQ